MRISKAALQLPLQFFAIFSGQKSFKENVIIGSKTANRFGLHILRVVLARGCFNLKRMFLSHKVTAQQRRAFARDGMIIVPGFVGPETLREILAEIDRCDLTARQLREGDTELVRIQMDAEARSVLPAISQIISSKTFKGLMAYTGATLSLPPVMLERLNHHSGENNADPQKTPHCDTFHPTMKAWLFLEDVTNDCGAFCFSKGSQRLSWRRLRWEYAYSLKARTMNDGHSEDGSFRLNDDDFRCLGIRPPEPVCVKAGTLVIANTNAVHCRGDAEPGKSRLELWANKRAAPFLPIPGYATPGALERFYNKRKRSWEKKDRLHEHTSEPHPFPIVGSDRLTKPAATLDSQP